MLIHFEESCIFYGVLSFLWAEFLWETFLSIRQHKVYKKSKEVPPVLNGILDEETFHKARLYGLDKSSFGIVQSLVAQLILTLIILCYGFHYFWQTAAGELERWGYSREHDLLHTAMFMLIINIFNTIVNIPFSVYYTFVLEEKHGFNKQTVGFFVKDKIKKFIVSQIIVIPIVITLVYIVKIGGRFFFVYLWLFAFVVLLFLMTVYPDFIAPLFDKYTPLPEGELRTSIEKLAASIEFPLYKLYVVEGSKRSSHSNAYFYGFFKNKRIVLFDTLLQDFDMNKKDAEKEVEEDKEEEKEKENDKEEEKEKEEKTEEEETDKKAGKKVGCNNEEVLAVLGHELGHWKLNHVIKNLVIAQVNIFLVFLVFGLLYQYKPMYTAFGFQDEQPIFIGLIIVLQFVFSPYNAVLSFLMTVLSRHFEFQADAFAKNLGKATYLRAALIKLNKDNLSFPIYDWLYSSWHHSHPPLLERLSALDKTE